MATTIFREFIESGALKVDTDKGFELTSGGRAPVYIDHRALFGHPRARALALDLWVEAVLRNLGPEQLKCSAVAGTATAGIAPAFGLAERMVLPFCYVRSQAKAYGLGRRIEGFLPEGSFAIVVDDMVSTGGSLLAAAQALRESEMNVSVSLLTSFTARASTQALLEKEGFSFVCVFTLRELLNGANEILQLDGAKWAILEDWLASVEPTSALSR